MGPLAKSKRPGAPLGIPRAPGPISGDWPYRAGAAIGRDAYVLSPGIRWTVEGLDIRSDNKMPGLEWLRQSNYGKSQVIISTVAGGRA
jgi:hypothetical protein